MRNLPFSVTSLRALIDGYDAWAPLYDRDVGELGDCSSEIVADTVWRQVEDRGALLLDVGAGTGLLGERLYRKGYRNLHGMDASHGMLMQAARNGIYRMLSRMVLGCPLGFAHRAFDGLTAAGVFSSGHVSPECLFEFDRIVRPGGKVIFSLKWDGTSENTFLTHLNRLVQSGRWQRRAVSAPYASWPGADPALQARVLVYQVL